MAMPPPPAALLYDYPITDNPPAQYQLFSSKLMVAAIIVLFIVVFIILFLHIYAKWFWRSPSAMITTRRLHRLHFIGQEVNPAAAHNIGLDKSAIDQLPAFIYKAPTAEGEREPGLAFLECAVCLTEFEENDKGRLLPTCKHSFHTDCIDMWLYSHSTCPLCRTVVMPTPLSVTIEQQNLQEEHQGEELQRGGEDAPPSTPYEGPLFTAHEGISIPSTINHGNAMQYPSNVLFWGNHTQVMASEGSFSSQRLQERPSSSSPPTTRAIPQITIEIPRRQDMNLLSPSPNDQVGSSQPMKSPGLRMSIKRILSREKRIIGSNQEGGDSPTKNTPRMSV